MKEQIEHFLCECGYLKLVTNREEFNIYFQLENSCVNTIFVLDYEHFPEFSKEEFHRSTQKTVWQFTDGGYAEVHALSLILTNKIQEARALSKEDEFCWIVDTAHKELVVDEDKTPDFYGMKNKIKQGLKEPFDAEVVREKLLERDVQGKPIPHSFWDGCYVTHLLILINVLIYILCVLTGEVMYVKGMRTVHLVVDEGEYYRVLTSMFLHGGIAHLCSNMLILYAVGEIVERGLGHQRYAALYIISGVGGGLISLYLDYLVSESAAVIGASGAVFGLIGGLLWITIRNHKTLGVLSLRSMVLPIIYMLCRGFTTTNIDNAAHIGGLLVGFLYCIYLYRKKRSRRRAKEDKG